MTTIYIESGICGFSTVARASKGKGMTLEISLKSDCKQITALGDKVPSMGMRDILKNPINENPVYERAGECSLHTSCPVPSGILKAAEAELGLALKKNVKMEFQDDN